MTLSKAKEMDNIFTGRLTSLPPLTSKVVKVILSCCKSDTIQERLTLLRDAVPELQRFCQQYGLDFQLVDMHQGPSNTSTNDHEMAGLRIQEISDAHKMSLGPFFVSIIGNKYGDYVLPSRIDATEFSHIRDCAFEAGKDINVLDEWYVQEGDGVEQVYVLQPISSKLKYYYDSSPENKELNEKDLLKWKKAHDALLEILQQCAEYVHDEGLLNEEQLHKYHMSALENELTSAVYQTEGSAERCICMYRSFEDLPQNVESLEMHNYVDIRKPNRPKIYKKAQERIKALKDTKIPSMLPEENILKFCIPWMANGIDPATCEEHEQYLKEFCGQFTTKVKELVDKFVVKEKSNLQMQEGAGLTSEVLSHLQVADSYTKRFVSRDSVVNQVERLVKQAQGKSDKAHNAILLHGEPGSGKTVVTSQIVKMMPTWLGDSVIVVPRFLGATTTCRTVRDMLESVCHQVYEVYKPKKSKFGDIPQDLEKLIPYFKNLIDKLPSPNRPLCIVLDFPAEFVEELEGDNLDWLPTNFQASTTIVIALTDSPALKLFRERIADEANLIRVTSLNDRELSEMVRLFLTDNSRLLVPEQVKIVTRAGARHPLPIFAKLLCRETQFINPSGNGKDPISSPVDAASILLQHVEERNGPEVTSRILRYLSAARYGLTEAELMDLLSCDDELLALVYPHTLPRVLRFPHRVWINIRIDLGPLIAIRNLDNKTLMSWSSSVIQKVAQQRYLSSNSESIKAHKHLASLFLETWTKGKKWEREDRKMEDSEEVDGCRYISLQPLLYGKTQYNLRRLSELWYHLANAGDLKTLKSSVVCNFEYLLAKTHASSVHHVLQELATIRCLVLDLEIDLVFAALAKSAEALMADPLQLAAELIGRLLPLKGQYPRDLDSLVTQAMEWCDQFTRPLLVPLTSWLPTQHDSLISTVQCGSEIVKMAVSYDNQQIFVTTNDRTLACYKLASSEKLWSCKAIHGEDVTCIAVSKDDRIIVTGSADKTLKLWTADGGKLLKTIQKHEGAISCVAMTPDCQRVVSGTLDGMVRVFNIEDGELVWSLTGSMDSVVAVTSNKYSDILIAASADCKVRMWSLRDFSQLNVIEGQGGVMSQMALSGDDMFFLRAYEDSRLNLSCLVTGTFVHPLEGHKGKIVDICLCPEGLYAGVATSEQVVYVYNIRSQELLQTLTGHSAPIRRVTITPNGHFLVTASADGNVRVWLLPKPKAKEGEGKSAHTDKVTCIAMSKDANFAITGSADFSLKLWNIDLCQIIHAFSDHTKPISCVAMADNGSFAVSGSEDGTVNVWSTDSGVVVVTFTEHEDAISSVLITSDSKRILSADFSNYMKLWVAATGEVLLSCMGPSAMVILTPDDTYAISGDRNELMKIWTTGSGESVKTINHVQVITCVTVTRDGQFTITGSEDMSLKIWETKTGKLTQILAGHDDKVTCVTTADHNRHVISGSEDSTLIVWNMSTGEIEKTLQGHTGIVTCCKMTSDGSICVSGSHDGTIRVWLVQTGVLITSFHIRQAVAGLDMSFDASFIVLQLVEGGNTPLLCLHNSPASDIKSQSQVDIDLKEESQTVLPIKPHPPLLHKQTSVHMPAVGRKSTSSAPDTNRIKAANNQKGRNQSYSDNSSSNGSTGKMKRNKRSGVCRIV
ncbi:NACHT domain- and WD repeat-containing protein 1-like [Diadema setosum]|uniref:NACHT domain- and WD repeat-containing protein 1-like n=1 Tax=Diadema setosum TaxID=31175 RepID=UPI003B3BBB62